MSSLPLTVFTGLVFVSGQRPTKGTGNAAFICAQKSCSLSSFVAILLRRSQSVIPFCSEAYTSGLGKINPSSKKSFAFVQLRWQMALRYETSSSGAYDINSLADIKRIESETEISHRERVRGNKYLTRAGKYNQCRRAEVVRS